MTARFNKNVLSVVNSELGGDFDLDAFTHVARFNRGREWMEMSVRSERDQVVHAVG